MAGKIRLAADLGAQRRIRGSFSKWYQPAGWRVAQPLAAIKHSENLTINPDVVQPAIRRVDAFVTLLPRVCRSLRSLLNSRLTGFNPRRARVVPVLSDTNKLHKLQRAASSRSGSPYCVSNTKYLKPFKNPFYNHFSNLSDPIF